MESDKLQQFELKMCWIELSFHYKSVSTQTAMSLAAF